MLKRLIITLALIIANFGFSQTKNFKGFTEIEKRQYDNLKELASYIYKKDKSEISKDTLFKKYVFFDYVTNDTVIERKERRELLFDTLFYYFKASIDSIGLKNYEAKPIRFYKSHEIYKPFDVNKTKLKSIKGEKMYQKDANVFAYYRKDEPENPIGVLLFEPDSNKLVAWIMINQGGYKYFLTFSLL